MYESRIFQAAKNRFLTSECGFTHLAGNLGSFPFFFLPTFFDFNFSLALLSLNSLSEAWSLSVSPPSFSSSKVELDGSNLSVTEDVTRGKFLFFIFDFFLSSEYFFYVYSIHLSY